MKFTHHHATIFFWIGLLAFAGFSAFAYRYYFASVPQQIACTQEAKLCPDGSAVGRIGPNCEFADCPDLSKSNFDTSTDVKTSAIVHGKVSIGPLCPVEPCKNTTNPYLGKGLIFKMGAEEKLARLNIIGDFYINLPTGNYSVTLSDCNYIGCSSVFPKSIRVETNKTFELNLDIDTGIR